MPVCNLTTFSCQQDKFKLLSKKFPFEHNQVFCFVSKLVAWPSLDLEEAN